MGVGPLLHAPFLLEHSFCGIPGSSSVVTAGRRVFVRRSALRVQNFWIACSSPRERAAWPSAPWGGGSSPPPGLGDGVLGGRVFASSVVWEWELDLFLRWSVRVVRESAARMNNLVGLL